MNQKYINALSARFKAEMAEAEANFSLYVSDKNLAAIGEHSDLMEEQEKWINQYVDAKDKLAALEELIKK